MSLFGKKKRAANESPIPETTDFPMKAYVYRQLPEKVGRTQVAGRVQGDFDGFTSAQDLEDMVAKVCGGGTYRCKVVKSQETKTHIGYHNFTIPGAPLIEGQPIDQENRLDPKSKDAGKVSKIEEEIEVEEAQARLDETKARRRAKQKQLGLIDDGDDSDDDSPTAPTIGMPGFEDPRVTQLLAQQKAMERRLEEKDREMERRDHEHKVREIEDRFSRKLDEVKSASALKQGDGGVATMMNAQMEAIKALMTASQTQTQAMMTSNVEMIKMMMSRDPSSGINDRVDRLVEKLLETKGQTGREVMEAMKESFNTGIMMARGGEQTPTSMADVAREFSGRVLDIVGDFVKHKGEMTKETMAQEIQRAASKLSSDIKASLLPHAMRPRALEPGAIPASEAMPQEPVQAPQQSNISREELRARVDKIMESFITDMENGTEEWQEVARREIPPSELNRIGQLTFENVAQYCMVHGTPTLVRRVIEKLVENGSVTMDQANIVLAQLGMQGEVKAPGQEESDEDVLAGDEEEEQDEAFIDEDSAAQGEPIPVPVEPEPEPPEPEEPKVVTPPKPRRRRGRGASA